MQNLSRSEQGLSVINPSKIRLLALEEWAHHS